MILVDSSIWIDHLRLADPALTERLNADAILSHPFVIGEISLGSLKQRGVILKRLRRLPSAVQARDEEVFALIETVPLFGLGIGFIDAHLLASTRLTAGASLWTRDRRLHQAALRLGVAWMHDRPH